MYEIDIAFSAFSFSLLLLPSLRAERCAPR
jgi:hypothetical protein